MGRLRVSLLGNAELRCCWQASRVKLDAPWRNMPTRTQKLCASLDAHLPASWPVGMRHDFLKSIQSMLTDLWQSIKPPKVCRPVMPAWALLHARQCQICGMGMTVLPQNMVEIHAIDTCHTFLSPQSPARSSSPDDW